jgi:AGCS family alanine or glycine:cation symporter
MEIIRACNTFFWNWSIIILLLGTGILFTVMLKFPQFLHIKEMFRCMFPKNKNDEGISPFATLCTAVGGQVGTGNLAGVATAIASGGPGAIFWMWIIGIIGMATSFGEAVLGQLYKEKNEDGSFRGGPTFYMSKGVKGKLGAFLSIAFTIVIVVGSGFIIAPLQINSIASGFTGVFNISPVIIGVIFAIITGLVVFGGITRLSKVASVLVPVMALLYLGIALICIIINIKHLPHVFGMIVGSAFGVKSAAGGALGFTVKQAFRYGSARGLFSNEAGQGTSPAIHASANVKHPAAQGFVAMFGIFMDTIVICTSTAFTILITGANENADLTGINLTQSAFNNVIGSFGPYFILICICCFAWTSCLADIYYGEAAIQCVLEGKKSLLTAYRLIAVLLLIVGAAISTDTMWEFADFFNALMVLFNVIALLILAKKVKITKDDYVAQKKQGIEEPVYDWDSIEL